MSRFRSFKTGIFASYLIHVLWVANSRVSLSMLEDSIIN